MNKSFIVSLIIWIAWSNFLFSQTVQIKRSVIASIGLPHISIQSGTMVICTAVTLGQPPNAGTISDGVNILRQGYQQPNWNNCRVQTTFEVSEQNLNNCGLYYSFEYSGSLDSGTIVNWHFGNNAVPMIATGAAPSLVGFSQTGPQEITITVTTPECSKTTTSFVTANGTPFMATESTVNAPCYGDKGSIDLTVLNGTAPIGFKWSNGKDTEDIANLGPGNYSYTLTDAIGCEFTNTIEITGSTEPLYMDAAVKFELCTDTRDGSIELEILNGATPITYNWSDGSTENSLFNLTAGDYLVTISDANGCKIDTSFKIEVYCDMESEDFIPDTFSPNGDNYNDLWDIPGIDRFPEHQVLLYNRWGDLIREWNGDFVPWDGTNSGGDRLPMGAFYYIIRLNNAEDTVFKGAITIIL